MVIETSSIVAIFFKEPERDDFLEKIEAAHSCSMSASTLVELCSIFLRKKEAVGVAELLAFLELFQIGVIDFDHVQALIAVDAYREYGRGRQNRAKLNFGDCFSYALAKKLGEPLLYKGDDFAWTDVLTA